VRPAIAVIASVVLALPLSEPEAPPDTPPLAAAASALPYATAQSGLGSEQNTSSPEGFRIRTVAKW
jgi:hypothetical protein